MASLFFPDRIRLVQAQIHSGEAVETSVSWWGLSENHGTTIWLWLTSLPWKDPPFLSSVNHLFRLGPSISWQTVSHNQRVNGILSRASHGADGLPDTTVACLKDHNKRAMEWHGVTQWPMQESSGNGHFVVIVGLTENGIYMNIPKREN